MRSMLALIAGLNLVLAASATASPLSQDATAAFSGSAIFDSPLSKATIEYAVFAPPDGQDNTQPMWLYAYQIFNDPSSSATLTSMSLGLQSDVQACDVGCLGTLGVPDGVEPLLSRLIGDPPTSADWLFDVPAGEHTQVLVFRSRHGWTTGPATILSAGQGSQGVVPTPSTMPEPASALLVGLGMLIVAARKNTQKAAG